MPSPAPPAVLARKLLWAVDGSPAPGSPVSDVAELTAAATSAVRGGGGHVLDASHVIFPNGAVTLVLILAESHLAIHTWPEENLVAVDLFSCGGIAADRVVAELTTALRLADTRVQRVDRGASARSATARTDTVLAQGERPPWNPPGGLKDP
jgi:S-adenosylmethionine decarboxylase